MNILLFLIPVSMGALILAAWAFIWAVKRGQFEDLDTPALDILREDEHDRPLRNPQPRGPAVDAAEPHTGNRCIVADAGVPGDVGHSADAGSDAGSTAGSGSPAAPAPFDPSRDGRSS